MSAGLRAVILGCGSSGGVPRIGGHWGVCDPGEPRNRRRRCSLLVEKREGQGITRVLVDTSPDMREQLLAEEVDWLDGVLFTHDHADQTHGIDDLRSLVINRMRRVDCYMDEATRQSLTGRFGYCFPSEAKRDYPAIINPHALKAGEEVVISGEGGAIRALPFLQEHGAIHSLGFRFGSLAYTSDAVGVPDESFALLQGAGGWIVDALRYRPHPSHAHLELTLEWINRLGVSSAILTNLHVDMDYQTLMRELPKGVVPAYDGMAIAFSENPGGEVEILK